ncbi:MAG TPA: TRAP transporter substrate-binding protein [Thermohalobaculum sp.]|nr:TRAP transporter substrate-binding protein [Thermohalobaculum sp.]
MRMILTTAAVAAALAAGAARAETWDMPMAYAESNFHTENAKEFAADVAECTGGELEIIIHGAGSLYGGDQIKRAVQTGQAPIGERLLSAHANEAAIFGFDSVPFLATSYEESEKLMDAARPALEEELDAQGLMLLYTVPWPPQGLYVNKEINSAADLAGLKFRAYNNATARLAELAEMQPVQIEAAELSQALATGVAEAFISSGATGYDQKVWEHLSHFYNLQAWLPRNAIIVNKDAFAALPEDQQRCLIEAGKTAGGRGAAESEELSNWYLEELAKAGMTVGDPSDQLRSDLSAFGETMAGEWAEEAGEAGQAVLDGYSGS